ncbi:hypothetical protein BC828DRAFT_385991 [Blastocladiella britannica]|nr:hypothetical protein BC828DRAFT_385991 [Blastocladiella britannica]
MKSLILLAVLLLILLSTSIAHAYSFESDPLLSAVLPLVHGEASSTSDPIEAEAVLTHADAMFASLLAAGLQVSSRSQPAVFASTSEVPLPEEDAAIVQVDHEHDAFHCPMAGIADVVDEVVWSDGFTAASYAEDWTDQLHEDDSEWVAWEAAVVRAITHSTL